MSILIKINNFLPNSMYIIVYCTFVPMLHVIIYFLIQQTNFNLGTIKQTDNGQSSRVIGDK